MNNNIPNNFGNGSNSGQIGNNLIDKINQELIEGTGGENAPSMMQGFGNVQNPQSAMQGVGDVKKDANIMQGAEMPKTPETPVMPGQGNSGINPFTLKREPAKTDDVLSIPNFGENSQNPVQMPNQQPTMQQPNVIGNPAPNGIENPMANNQIGIPNNNQVNQIGPSLPNQNNNADILETTNFNNLNQSPQMPNGNIIGNQTTNTPGQTNIIGQNVPNINTPEMNKPQVQNVPNQVGNQNTNMIGNNNMGQNINNQNNMQGPNNNINMGQANPNSVQNPTTNSGINSNPNQGPSVPNPNVPQNKPNIPTGNLLTPAMESEQIGSTRDLNNAINGIKPTGINKGVSAVGQTEMNNPNAQNNFQDFTPKKKFPLSKREMILVGIALVGIVVVIIMYT